MKRHLFILLAGTSLLLCAAAAKERLQPTHWQMFHVAGADSYAGFGWFLELDQGSISLVRFLRFRVPNGPHEVLNLNPQYRFHFAGIGYYHWVSTDAFVGPRLIASETRGRSISISLFWFAAFFFALAVFFIRDALRYVKSVHEFPVCCICGYDLRATPHRCPECGTIPAKPAEAKA